MSNVLIILVALFVLGLMVLVHEWGHFMVAKLFGVRVDVFSFGFGPRLWGWRSGPTDYRLSALPVGGYVKMAGDNPAEDRSGAPDEFLSKPRWQRVLIAAAGPAMNILIAVILFAGLFSVATPWPAYFSKPVQVAAVGKDSPADKAGVRAGDRLVEINGLKNPDWEKAETELQLAPPGGDVHLVYEREGQLFPVTLRATATQRQCDVYAVLGYPPDPVVVDQVASGTPAETAGLHADDVLSGINGEPLVSWCQFVDGVQQSDGQPVELRVRRGERELRLRIRPAQTKTATGTRWQVGLSYRPQIVYHSLPVNEASSRAVLVSARLSRQIIFLVGDLFRGRVSLKQMEGPLGIGRESVRAAKRGVADLVNLMAVISLNLAVLNLLPIPILDGGHILLLTIEGALRRDLSLTVKERFVQAGMVFLLVIIAIVMYNDVLKLVLNH